MNCKGIAKKKLALTQCQAQTQLRTGLSIKTAQLLISTLPQVQFCVTVTQFVVQAYQTLNRQLHKADKKKQDCNYNLVTSAIHLFFTSITREVRESGLMLPNRVEVC